MFRYLIRYEIARLLFSRVGLFAIVAAFLIARAIAAWFVLHWVGVLAAAALAAAAAAGLRLAFARLRP